VQLGDLAGDPAGDRYELALYGEGTGAALQGIAAELARALGVGRSAIFRARDRDRGGCLCAYGRELTRGVSCGPLALVGRAACNL